MTKEENRSYIKKSESLVKPRDITAIAFLGDFNRYLPKKVQRSIMRKGGGKIPYMGFIVEPYGFFAAFRILDTAAARAMLPDGYELADASLFKNGEKHPLAILSAFSTRTSAFMGMRLECYVIARKRETGSLSWIIVDYRTNTNSHDPKNGFCGYTGDPAIHTTTPYGELLVDVKDPAGGGDFAARADLNAGVTEELDEELWVEGNMCVDYGGALKDESSVPFSLIFDPVLMEKAARIPPDKVEIEANAFLNGIIDPKRPESVAVFPYSQHFIIRQDLKDRRIARKDDLLREIKTFLDRGKLKTMSGDDLKKPIFRGMATSFFVNLAIIVFLIVLLLTR
ncbi:MAG: hypothetical protein JXD23_02155 [Spirochaetales bacterium]|nr:hypothetical protein [Spirochaetales bacterium]